MKIALTGSSGFLATSFKKMNSLTNVEFFNLKRNESDKQWKEAIQQCDVVMNFAGAPVVQRWTKKNKQIILDSRVNTTRRIVRIINDLPEDKAPGLLISASAIGIYPQTIGDKYDESTKKTGNNFLAEVVMEWENAARELKNPATRLVLPRIGVVLGSDGGMLKMVAPLFKLGLGGKLGSGRQGVSFIHINDLVRALQYFIEKDGMFGVYNVTSPHPITNKRFTKSLAKVLKRPAFVPVPAFAIRLVFGEAARVVTKGSLVYPKNLLSEGFDFEFQEIDEALDHFIIEVDT
ncbi:MAG: TIGR01777 family oxidoreductase [Prolixibacteraceae bacterium]|jgi:uncharacterized protein (TIGR01777 family)|nr:TIGR01777 family oxidoreductase [Prolixibacteraceae bacterium]